MANTMPPFSHDNPVPMNLLCIRRPYADITRNTVFSTRRQFSTACKPSDNFTTNLLVMPSNYDEKFRGPVL